MATWSIIYQHLASIPDTTRLQPQSGEGKFGDRPSRATSWGAGAEETRRRRGRDRDGHVQKSRARAFRIRDVDFLLLRTEAGYSTLREEELIFASTDCSRSCWDSVTAKQ